MFGVENVLGINNWKKSFFNLKFNNMMKRIYRYLEGPVSVEGYDYIMRLLIRHKKLINRAYTKRELLKFNCIKESIATRIASDLKSKTFIDDELIELISILLYPENQETIFLPSIVINKEESTGLLYFFDRLYWKNIIVEKQINEDNVYWDSVNDILENTVVIGRKKRFKNNAVSVVCCPFYIAVFAIKVILLKNFNLKEYYNKLIENKDKNKFVKTLLLYIAFTISHEVRAIKDGTETIDLHAKSNYMQLREYLLDLDWDNLELFHEQTSLNPVLKNRLKSIVKEFSTKIDTDCEDAELMEYQLISGEEPDNAPAWVDKKENIENLFNGVFVNAY